MAEPISENKSQSRSSRARPDGLARAGNTGGAGPVRRITSAELLGAASQIVIEHAGQEYRLCKTRNGKLILVK